MRLLGRVWWLYWLLPVGVMVAMGFMLPRRTYQPEKRLNMLVLDKGHLRTPDTRGYLMQCLVPENDLLQRGQSRELWRPPMSGKVAQRLAGERPVYIQQPAQVQPGMKYHLVVVTEQASGCGRDYERELEDLNNCIVVTLGAADTSGRYASSDLSLVTRRVIPSLKHLGLAIDSCMLTLVDATPEGVLANAALGVPGRQWRNIVWWNARPDTTVSVAAHARLVLTGNQASYGDVYACWRDRGLEADVLPARSMSEAMKVITDITSGELPVSSSRLELAHQKALSLGYNEQYVMFVDYSIPSGKHRFFIYDYLHRRYAVISKCAHGCGPGNTEERPFFSNEPGSCSASLGDFAVKDVRAMYKNGRIAIDIDGLDPTNDKALDRGLMIHGGMKREGEIYPEYIQLGTISEGCVALSDIPFSHTATIRSYSPTDILLQAYY